MKDKLLKWKADYGAIFSVMLEDTEIYYRTLTAWEIQSIVELKKAKKAQVDVELATCVLATLEPTPVPSFNRPGTISTLASEIWDKSVPSEGSLETMIEKARAWTDLSVQENYGIALAAVMCKHLPSLDFAYLLTLSSSQLFKLAAIVEKMIEVPFMDGGTPNTTESKATKVIDGVGVSQDQADSANAALSRALSDFKKNKT